MLNRIEIHIILGCIDNLYFPTKPYRIEEIIDKWKKKVLEFLFNSGNKIR